MFGKGMTKKSIADKYNCSITTVALWLPEDDTLRKLKFKPRVKKVVCHKCNAFIQGHRRCKSCTSLIHGEIDYCDWCIARLTLNKENIIKTTLVYSVSIIYAVESKESKEWLQYNKKEWGDSRTLKDKEDGTSQC